MNGHVLEQVEYEKDLDIIIDLSIRYNELKFHVQASAAVKKANQILWINKEDYCNKKRKNYPTSLHGISKVSSRICQCSVGSTLQRRPTTSEWRRLKSS